MYAPIIIIVIIIVLAIVCVTKNTIYENSIKTPSKDINDIKSIMKNIIYEFNKNNLQYWIICGTLLGAIRHHDVIPWDDDIDIAINSKDKQILLSMETTFKNYGYGIFPIWFGYKIYKLDGIPSREDNYNYPFVDVFLMNTDNEYCTYSSIRAKMLWRKEWFNVNNLFPLRKYKLGDMVVTGPNKPYEYLNRSYGTDWPVIGYRQFDHKQYKWVKKKKFIISQHLGLMPYLFVYGNDKDFNDSIYKYCFNDFILIHITNDNLSTCIDE